MGNQRRQWEGLQEEDHDACEWRTKWVPGEITQP